MNTDARERDLEGLPRVKWRAVGEPTDWPPMKEASPDTTWRIIREYHVDE